MEGDHHVKLKEQAKLIKAEQERAHHKFQDQMKHKKKEVILMTTGGKKNLLSNLLKKALMYIVAHISKSVFR